MDLQFEGRRVVIEKKQCARRKFSELYDFVQGLVQDDVEVQGPADGLGDDIQGIQLNVAFLECLFCFLPAGNVGKRGENRLWALLGSDKNRRGIEQNPPFLLIGHDNAQYDIGSRFPRFQRNHDRMLLFG